MDQNAQPKGVQVVFKELPYIFNGLTVLPIGQENVQDELYNE